MGWQPPFRVITGSSIPTDDAVAGADDEGALPCTRGGAWVVEEGACAAMLTVKTHETVIVVTNFSCI
jgi:hypothetical protein